MGDRETIARETAKGEPSDLLVRATVALHDLECSPDCRDSLTTMSGYAKQAQAALAALDLDALKAAAREEGRREAAEAIHDRIIAELVCCEIYAEHAEAETYDEAVHGHAICYWGEAGARIALDYPWAEEATERGQDGEGT